MNESGLGRKRVRRKIGRKEKGNINEGKKDIAKTSKKGSK